MRYKYILVLALVSTSVFSQGQKKYAADKYFGKYSYVKSASLYEKVYEKGDHSELVVSRLADSYYHTNDYKNAVKWYGELFATVSESAISEDHYYRYIQSLKNVGDYTKSAAILALSKTHNKNIGLAVSSEVNSYDTSSMYSDVENLSINTSYSDYNNIVSSNKLYFSSTRPENERKTKLYGWNKQPYYTMYAVERSQGESGPSVTELTGVSSLDGKVNGRYHDASPVLTKDGKTMYFTRDNTKFNSLRTDAVRTSNLKLYKATLKDDKWTCVKELPFNNKAYSVGQPALSADEKYLYFVSDMPGGVGKTDLYKVAITGEDSYGVPENLGNTINSAGDEMFPYVSEDVLYFSSDGHVGLGGLDVFKSSINGNSYTQPENLKKPINSQSDDFSFVLLADERVGYFSSNRVGGKGDDDIYSFRAGVPEEIVPEICEKQVRGIVYDKLSKEVLAGAEVQWLNAKGEVVKTVVSDAKGAYDLGTITCLEGSYGLQVSKAAYNDESSSFGVTNLSASPIGLTTYLLPKEIKIDSGNFDVRINPIYFDFDKSNIRADAARELNKVVKVMKDFPDILLRIESHTDSRGNDVYNEQLSDRRAKSSRDYIISQGVRASRITSAKGYGEYRLLNECDDATRCSEEKHQINRRSYFYISNNPKNVSVQNQIGE